MNCEYNTYLNLYFNLKSRNQILVVGRNTSRKVSLNIEQTNREAVKNGMEKE